MQYSVMTSSAGLFLYKEYRFSSKSAAYRIKNVLTFWLGIDKILIRTHGLWFQGLKRLTGMRQMDESVTKASVYDSKEWDKRMSWQQSQLCNWQQGTRQEDESAFSTPIVHARCWEDCLQKIIVWNFPHERVKMYSHEIICIVEGINKVWHTNKTKVSLWWYINFRFE